MVNDSKADILAKMVYDREFDVPEWVINKFDVDAVYTLMNTMVNRYTGNDERYFDIMNYYLSNPNIKNFFDKLKDKLNIKKMEHIMTIQLAYDGVFTILLLNNTGWRKLGRLIHSKYRLEKDWFIAILSDYLLMSDKFINTTKEILNIVNIDSLYLLKTVNNFMLKNDEPEYLYKEKMNRLMGILNVNKDYHLVRNCIYMGLPSFFANGDITDLYRYLSMVVDTKWKLSIDPNISNIHIVATDVEIIDMIKYIFKYLNRSIMIYSVDMMSKNLFDSVFYSTDMIIDNPPVRLNENFITYGIKDYKDLIKIYGKNYYGLPMDIQQMFIKNNGDIRTMLDESGDLRPEASIIKSVDQLNFIISNISIEDLRFLLYNSSDFIKIVLSEFTDIRRQDYIKILKALFENPINEDLWNALNNVNDSRSGIDYREAIIRRIIRIFTLDAIFTTVPESMLYIEPSALYVTRNLSEDNIPFIPITKLIPYIPSIVAKNEYTKFNRYCKGVYVSISKAIDMKTLENDIVSYKKYGYICDLSGEDLATFIDTYM